MNASEMLPRLRAFAPDSPLEVAVPVAGGGSRVLPIVAIHHSGYDPSVVDHDRGGLEMFTPAWDAPAPHPTGIGIGEIVARLEQHKDDAHVRVAVPIDGVHPYRALYPKTVGFAVEAKVTGGKLPVQIITEPWEGLMHTYIAPWDEACKTATPAAEE